MSLANVRVPRPVNEPIRDYAPGSPERAALEKEIDRQRAETVDVPLVIGGREVRTGDVRPILCPHDHRRPLGRYHLADPIAARAAAQAALDARRAWREAPWEDRAAVFLRAAELIAGPWRYALNAATMLNQSKNVFQAELDAACELADYLRFNVGFLQKIYDEQIDDRTPSTWTRMEYRPLEGFVFAVTPFNFTAIAGNLPTAPALMGNTVVWKPASSAVHTAFLIYRILRRAGLPDGVINFLPGSGKSVADPVIDQRDFAGLHFTGSTDVFTSIWKRVGDNVAAGAYRTYPRLVGETGGKGFIVAHPDADPGPLATALFRGAFEYQGQKCSAGSRAYIPASLWNTVRDRLAALAGEAKVGDVRDFETFMGAVIDKAAYDNIVSYLEEARSAPDAKIVVGGAHDAETGYFIRPTVIQTSDPGCRSMTEEIFGPVLTVFVYEDARYWETLDVIDRTSPYGLTGAVFARNPSVIRRTADRLIDAAGNFSINDKPSGSMVGQQPFGGARLSGTNDKAGGPANLLRWTSPRTIKENFLPPVDWTYPPFRSLAPK